MCGDREHSEVNKAARSQCAGKLGYLTWDAASKTIKHARIRSRRFSGGPLRPYRCRFCSRWHLGSA
jgi:hypothetical protein